MIWFIIGFCAGGLSVCLCYLIFDIVQKYRSRVILLQDLHKDSINLRHRLERIEYLIWPDGEKDNEKD